MIFEEDALVNNADPSEGWNKLIDLAKKATPVVALVILGKSKRRSLLNRIG